MYVNVAVLRETQPHERRIALTPSVIPKLIKLGARLHMQAGAGLGVRMPDAMFKDVAIATDRLAMVRAADVVLSVQPPAHVCVHGVVVVVAPPVPEVVIPPAPPPLPAPPVSSRPPLPPLPLEPPCPLAPPAEPVSTT